MYVIWHAYEFTAHDVVEMIFQFIEPIRNHLPRLIHPHFTIHNIPEHTHPFMRTYGDKIRPRLGVIVFVHIPLKVGHRFRFKLCQWFRSKVGHPLERCDAGVCF
jgi:hypothetical protein